jgi:hypothetical protein
MTRDFPGFDLASRSMASSYPDALSLALQSLHFKLKCFDLRLHLIDLSGAARRRLCAGRSSRQRRDKTDGAR